MKKRILTLTILLTSLFFLVSCANNPKSDLYISKYFETYEMKNNLIELYNPTKKDIDLSVFTLEIYPNGDQIAEYNIQLTGTIESKGYYVIGQPGADSELLDKIDLKTNDLNYNGNDTLVLKKNGKTYDTIGIIGNAVDFGKDVTLIRKDNYAYPQKEFSAYSYIGYAPEVFQYLKNTDYEIKTNEDMINGPSLTESDKELPFIDEVNPQYGGGGAIKVRLNKEVDGDTAYFADENNKIYKVRFAYIDTPEVVGTGSPTGQPWGYPASNFTKNILIQADELYIQSIKGEPLLDQYDRYLGLIWANGKLVNFLVGRAGLSDVNLSNVSEEENTMVYKNVPYHAFIANAVARAKANNWSFFGENDPMWDYEKGIKNGENPTYLPDKREYDSKKDK